MLAFARTVQVPQRALQILNLALIIDLLPLGQFQRFQHFLHLIERMFQLVDDPVHLVDGIRDRGRAMRRFGLARLLGLMTFMTLTPLRTLFTRFTLFASLTSFMSLVLFRFLHRRWRCFGSLRRNRFAGGRHGAARFTASGMAAPSAPGTTPASRPWRSGCGGFRLIGRALFCFVRRHKDRLPTAR